MASKNTILDLVYVLHKTSAAYLWRNNEAYQPFVAVKDLWMKSEDLTNLIKLAEDLLGAKNEPFEHSWKLLLGMSQERSKQPKSY